MKKEGKTRETRVTHTMANGEVRDSLEGYDISFAQLPEVTQLLLIRLMKGPIK